MNDHALWLTLAVLALLAFGALCCLAEVRDVVALVRQAIAQSCRAKNTESPPAGDGPCDHTTRRHDPPRGAR